MHEATADPHDGERIVPGWVVALALLIASILRSVGFGLKLPLASLRNLITVEVASGRRSHRSDWRGNAVGR